MLDKQNAQKSYEYPILLTSEIELKYQKIEDKFKSIESQLIKEKKEELQREFYDI
jgi:hypothetical protein